MLYLINLYLYLLDRLYLINFMTDTEKKANLDYI